MAQKEKIHSFLEETVIEYPPYRFLITKVPSDASMNEYIQLLKEHNVSIVIRACEPTYSQERLEKAGIRVLDFNFPDGSGPPKHIVQKWLDLLKEVYDEKKKDNEGKAIALHCVAGLGRAPVLVGIALIHAGMSAIDAVDFIRKKRRGALNKTQLEYLMHYKKNKSDCVVM